MNTDTLLAAARAQKPWMVGVRRQLHMNPELGLEEHATADAIQGWLEELGLECRRRDTAVIGLLRGARPGRTVALRADIDALPIQEAGADEWRSRTPGVMHACGHDAHTTIQLGAARLLCGLREELAGNVKLLFQPAEETVGGAERMVREGCLEAPHVDQVYGLHVMPYLPVGHVELKKGVLCGASTTLVIRVHGRSAHGAYPETGIDAVLIAAQLVTALHTLVGRYVSPLAHAVLTLGTIHGGTASNILADQVELRGGLRTADDGVRDALLARVRDLVEAVPRALGGSGEVEVTHGYEALVNHDESVDLVAAAAGELLGAGRISWKEKPSMGVEDFSCFIKDRPGAFYNLGCGNAAEGITAPLHSAGFRIDEDCLVFGAAMQAAVVLRFLATPR